jgi:hypothetical protein
MVDESRCSCIYFSFASIDLIIMNCDLTRQLDSIDKSVPRHRQTKGHLLKEHRNILELR